MGIMDVFKKKSELDSLGDMNLNTSQMTADNTGIPMTNLDSYHAEGNANPNMGMQSSTLSQMGQSQGGFQQPESEISRDIQMISLKLDAIKSEMDAMNQRIKNIEAIAEKEQSAQGQQKKWY